MKSLATATILKPMSKGAAAAARDEVERQRPALQADPRSKAACPRMWTMTMTRTHTRTTRVMVARALHQAISRCPWVLAVGLRALQVVLVLGLG